MCGIGGCVMPPGQPPPADRLERLAAALAHRGPDGRGILMEGSVGLVNTRLAIVDPSELGSQPMAEGGWALTYNGEVFNHAELRGELPGHSFHGGSDTETVLAALTEWGDEAIPRFNGLFAFAALDAARRRVLLVRDRFGVKPLYLAWHEGALWFASEVQALLAAGIPRRPRPEAIARTLTAGWAAGPHELMDGVTRLMPGTTATVSLDDMSVSESRWFDPAALVDRARQDELAARPREELSSLLDDELSAAVHRRLMADVPIGTMCSGGIDSGLATALARERDHGIVGYTASIRAPGTADELPHAQALAKSLGVELRAVHVTPASWRDGLVRAIRHYEHPLPNEGPVTIAQISRLAREDGVKALLAGEGADELFGGYRRLHRTAFADFLGPSARVRHMIDSARGLGARETAREVARRIRRVQPSPTTTRLDLRGPSDFEEGASGAALAAYAHHHPERTRLEAGLLSELSITMPHLLNRMDGNGMQHSVEVRLPFLDPGVAELALNLPLEARVAPRPKGILRDLAGHELPRRTARRPKQPGLIFNAREWIEPAARPEFLREGRLRDVLQLDRARWHEQCDLLRGRAAVLVWSAEVWCRLMLEGTEPAAVEADLWRDGP